MESIAKRKKLSLLGAGWLGSWFCFVGLGIIAGCSPESDYQLRLSFPDQQARDMVEQVVIRTINTNEFSCEELLDLNPEDLAPGSLNSSSYFELVLGDENAARRASTHAQDFRRTHADSGHPSRDRGWLIPPFFQVNDDSHSESVVAGWRTGGCVPAIPRSHFL